MKRSTVLIPIALVIFLIPAASMRAQVGNFTADNFAVLASSTVTNTGPTVLNGNLGLSPGTSITGFYPTAGGPGIVNGTISDGVTAAATGQTDASTAYGYLSGLSPTGILTADLGGQTLTPGVYSYSSSAQLTGALTLNFEGLPNQNIVFVIGSTLTTASGSSVIIE